MMLFAFLGLFPAMLGMVAQSAQPEGVRRVVIQDEMIISIPIRPRPSPKFDWTEEKDPKCIAASRVVGAMLSGPSSIDFVLRNRARVRAVMDSECPALDFYKGFYLQPDDERICAKREFIQNRVGASCRIERFRNLIPHLKQVKR